MISFGLHILRSAISKPEKILSNFKRFAKVCGSYWNYCKGNEAWKFPQNFRWLKCSESIRMELLSQVFSVGIYYDNVLLLGIIVGPMIQNPTTPSIEYHDPENLEHRIKKLEELNQELQRNYEFLKDQRMCVICLEEEIQRILLPCHHACLCNSCGTNSISTCPICRAAISTTEKIYI